MVSQPIRHIFIFLLCLLVSACGGEETTEQASSEKTHALIEQGLEHFKAGDYESAKIAFEDLIRREKEVLTAKKHLARVYMEWGRTEDVIRISKELMAIDPTMAEPYALMGEIYFRTSRFDQAIKSSRQAITRNPDLPYPYKVIGEIYLRRGNVQAGLLVLKHAALLMPDDPETIKKLGSAYIKVKEYNNALDTLQTGLKLDPNRPGLHFNLAVVYSNLNEPKKAIDHIEIAEKLYAETKNIRWEAKSRDAKATIIKKFNLGPNGLTE